ncbi:hypothetical protein BVRB_2g047640 [Beta vulgaris subsp. vulgaris]|nr:hypothetical protein BVRB_2g047640 [Beta vulgaris subsp. vulgaris]
MLEVHMLLLMLSPYGWKWIYFNAYHLLVLFLKFSMNPSISYYLSSKVMHTY